MSETPSSTAPRERELHELLSHDMVDLYVGPENTHWVLHEKLLCHRSAFFRQIFYGSSKTKRHTNTSKTTHYGLPDEDDAPFRLFVAWLYADVVPSPRTEADLAPLLELYLMGEKWRIDKLSADVLVAVRRWYYESDSWPGLRRVQFVYANTGKESELRRLMVDCVARMLVLGGKDAEGQQSMPKHWDHALRQNGELAVDVILSVQRWRLDGEAVPDVRREGLDNTEKQEEEGVSRVDEKIQADEESEGKEDLVDKIKGSSLGKEEKEEDEEATELVEA